MVTRPPGLQVFPAVPVAGLAMATGVVPADVAAAADVVARSGWADVVTTLEDAGCGEVVRAVPRISRMLKL